jgi:hypothetical protein
MSTAKKTSPPRLASYIKMEESTLNFPSCFTINSLFQKNSTSISYHSMAVHLNNVAWQMSLFPLWLPALQQEQCQPLGLPWISPRQHMPAKANPQKLEFKSKTI